MSQCTNKAAGDDISFTVKKEQPSIAALDALVQTRCISQQHKWLTGNEIDAYPAPEPDLIEQLSKCDVPSDSSSPDSEVSTSLPQNISLKHDFNQRFTEERHGHQTMMPFWQQHSE